ARVLPPGPDGVTDPWDGRRSQPDRKGRSGRRGRRARGARASDDAGRVLVRRLLEELQDVAPDGPSPGRHEADPGPRQPARRPRPGRRKAARARRGDHPVDDAARAGAAAPDRRLAPAADRARERHGRPTVNQLLEARKQMAKLMKQTRSGKMPSLPGLAAPGAPNGARAATARKTKSKRKKKKSRR